MPRVANVLPLLLTTLALLLTVSLAWSYLAPYYNQFLVRATERLLPDQVQMQRAGYDIFVYYQEGTRTHAAAIRGLAVHSGLILVLALVGATPGMGLVRRALWLLAFAALFVVLHVAGVALMAIGFARAVRGAPFSLGLGNLWAASAVFWGLLPALVGGAWCFKYWRPVVRPS